MFYLRPHCDCLPLENYIGVFVRGVGFQICRAQFVDKYNWKQQDKLLVVKRGDSIEQTKVFKAHAALQGFRKYLISALKLLVNQQKMEVTFYKILGKTWAKRAEKVSQTVFVNSLMLDP